MHFSPTSSKTEIRRLFAGRRRACPARAVKSASDAIARRLLALPEFTSATLVALYAAIECEVELECVIAECGRLGKRVFLPRFNSTVGTYEMVEIENFERDTKPGRFAIREPVPQCLPMNKSISHSGQLLWLVPGIAFDLQGRRLGRGGGYYDRLLAARGGFRVGVAYDWQIVADLPEQAHDQVMDMVVSECRVVRPQPQPAVVG